MANATSKSKNTKPSWFRRVGAKFKETFSELKRVTWPKFGTALKTTGVVLVIVIVCALMIAALDYVFGRGIPALAQLF